MHILIFIIWHICCIVDEEFRVLVIPGHTKVPETKKEAKRIRRQVSSKLLGDVFGAL